MSEFIKLIDVSLCTGCRGCQVACKQWNELPAEKTGFTGSLQNPADLSYDTWCLIRFDEVEKDGKLKWVMRHDACLHCEDPGCIKACPSPGALTKTKEGAVLHNEKYCIGCKACSSACPFDIPRHNLKKEKMSKCSLCYDRTTEGKQPACVTSCPTGCLSYGLKSEMMKKAEKRAAAIGGTVYPNNPHYKTNVLYILPKDVQATDIAHTNPNPSVPTSVVLWKNLLKPLTLIGLGGVGVGAALHYLIKGPHEVHEKQEGGE